MPPMHLDDHSSPTVISRLTTKISDGSELLDIDLESVDQILEGQDESSVPFLDRSFLEGWNASGPQLVRYFGMVQDMLEPEYYISNLDGKSMHFRDIPATAEAPQEFVASNLAERTPLMIVPVPFATPWFLKAFQSATSPPTTTVKIPESPEMAEAPSKNRKRDRDESDDNGNDNDMDTTASKPRTENIMECEEVLQGQELDWWPPGCMKSSQDQCPVLAKFYYDQTMHKKQRRLRLNDLVELVGVLSMDPWEADFQDEFFGMTPPPPPSRLPRLHVLSYQIRDLDKLAQKHISSHELIDHDEQPAITMHSPASSQLSDIATTIFKDQALAKTLCMSLLSKAQREHNQKDAQILRAPEHAVGCMSLQISGVHNSKQLFHHLSTVLRATCPVLATVDLVKPSQYPAKIEGRMIATPWQLPNGSTILIHVGRNCSGVNRELLEELVSQHRMPYVFDGGMKVPFDADFRIIVITADTTRLPCSMYLRLSSDLEVSGGDLEQFRSSLALCREIGNIELPKEVLEKAQEDFLVKRAEARKQATPVPQENDFHRWLTLCRLQARSRLHPSATLEDWERALALDEATQQIK